MYRNSKNYYLFVLIHEHSWLIYSENYQRKQEYYQEDLHYERSDRYLASQSVATD